MKPSVEEMVLPTNFRRSFSTIVKPMWIAWRWTGGEFTFEYGPWVGCGVDEIRALVDPANAKGDKKCRISHTPKVSREFVEKWGYEIHFAPTVKTAEELMKIVLHEAGVEVEEVKEEGKKMEKGDVVTLIMLEALKTQREGMVAENQNRMRRGESLAFVGSDFYTLECEIRKLLERT